MSGFGLTSTSVTGTPTSAFIIRADKFAIVDPLSEGDSLTNNPSAGSVPFFIQNGNTFIKNAFIKDLTADKIDSRGLSIRDTSGNILFNAQSSTPVKAELVAGLGSLAYKNNIYLEQVVKSPVQELSTPTRSPDFSSGDQFGFGACLSRNGNVLVAGARYWDGNTSDNRGAVYTFLKSTPSGGSSWSIVGSALFETINSGEVDRWFGYRCATNEDGTLLAVTSFGFDSSLTDTGKVAIYSRPTVIDTWTLVTTILPPEPLNSFQGFGSGLSMSSDGTIIAIGCFRKNIISLSNVGTVYIYNFNGSSASLIQTIEPNTPQTDLYFGTDVSLNTDATRMVVSAVDTGQSYIYTYTRYQNTWTLDSSISTLFNNENERFGNSISLDGVGNTIIIGCPAHFSSTGALRIYDLYVDSTTYWKERAHGRVSVTSDPAVGDEFGCSVSTNSSGTLIVAGSRGWENSKSGNIGAVYTLNINSLVASDVYNNQISISSSGNLVGAGGGQVTIGGIGGLSNSTRNVLAGAGGFATGNLTWDSTGTRTSGSGIGFTEKGIVAYNSAGNPTFVLNGTNGNAEFKGDITGASGSFSGSLNAATGTFSGILDAKILQYFNPADLIYGYNGTNTTTVAPGNYIFETTYTINVLQDRNYFLDIIDLGFSYKAGYGVMYPNAANPWNGSYITSITVTGFENDSVTRGTKRVGVGVIATRNVVEMYNWPGGNGRLGYFLAQGSNLGPTLNRSFPLNIYRGITSWPGYAEGFFKIPCYGKTTGTTLTIKIRSSIYSQIETEEYLAKYFEARVNINSSDAEILDSITLPPNANFIAKQKINGTPDSPNFDYGGIQFRFSLQQYA